MATVKMHNKGKETLHHHCIECPTVAIWNALSDVKITENGQLFCYISCEKGTFTN